MSAEKDAQIKKQEIAEQMVLLLLRSFQKRKLWWNRLKASRLAKIRSDLEQTLNEADHRAGRFAKNRDSDQTIPMTEEDETE